MTDRYQVVPHNGIAALLDHEQRKAYPFSEIGRASEVAQFLNEGRPNIFSAQPGLYESLQETNAALFAEVEQTLKLSAGDMSALRLANMVRKTFGEPLLSDDDVEFVDGKYGREMHLANGCPCGHNTPDPVAPDPTKLRATRLSWWDVTKLGVGGLVDEVRDWFRRRP